MTKRTLRACAALAGAAYLAVGITHFMLPKDQIHFALGIGPRFFASLAAQPGVYTAHYWAFALASIAALGVVLGLAPNPSADGARFFTLVGVLGLGVNAANFLVLLGESLRGAAAWSGLDPAGRRLMIAQGLHSLDPYALFGFGLTGAWFVAANLAALRDGRLARWLGYLGLVAGVAFELVFVGKVLHLPGVIDAAAAGAIGVGPLWFWGIALTRGDPGRSARSGEGAQRIPGREPALA